MKDGNGWMDTDGYGYGRVSFWGMKEMAICNGIQETGNTDGLRLLAAATTTTTTLLYQYRDA
jgi:hypothetical protein